MGSAAGRLHSCPADCTRVQMSEQLLVQRTRLDGSSVGPGDSVPSAWTCEGGVAVAGAGAVAGALQWIDVRATSRMTMQGSTKLVEG